MSAIAILGAGGTIAMEGVHPFDWVDYGDSGRINPVDVVVGRMDLGLPQIAHHAVPFRMLPGTGMQATDWFDLHGEVSRLQADPQIGGIVITHGTATLEDTAFFLRLTLAATKPVIVTGAQRPPNTASSDALAGLRQAVIAAAKAPAGVYAVINGQIFCPDELRKTANHALDAFAAPEFGPLGRVNADASIYMRSLQKLPYQVIDISTLDPTNLARVDVVSSYVGADDVAISAYLAAGAKGLISAGFAPGRAAGAERPALIAAAKAGVLVVQSSLAHRGYVPRQPYNEKEQILGGGFLAPNKARTLVSLAISSGYAANSIQDLLQNW